MTIHTQEELDRQRREVMDAAHAATERAHEAVLPRVVASIDVPISINGLKRHLKRIKEQHGSSVQVVPHSNRIDFVKHEKGRVPK